MPWGPPWGRLLAGSDSSERIVYMSVISAKQKAANQRNAQQSCGPKTPEGKSNIRFNALTYGLRTRASILERENAAEYSRLWDELDADWQPQNRAERCYLETMVTSQWLLARVAESERRIYEEIEFGEHQFKMLGYVIKQRAHLERSFRTAIDDMERSFEKPCLKVPQSQYLSDLAFALKPPVQVLPSVPTLPNARPVGVWCARHCGGRSNWDLGLCNVHRLG